MSKTLYFEGAGWSGADSSKATIGNGLDPDILDKCF